MTMQPLSGRAWHSWLDLSGQQSESQSSPVATGLCRQSHPKRNLHAGGIQFLAFLCLCIMPSAGFAQAIRSTKVVTLSNGLQYEGQLGSIDGYSVSLAAIDNEKAQNVVMIDDGLRRVFFNRDMIGPLPADSNRVETEIEIWQKSIETSTSGAGNLVRASPFNQFGHRTLTTRNAEGELETVTQGITMISPRYCEVKTLASGSGRVREWNMRIATSTIDPGILRGLLRQQIVDPDQPREFLAIVDFYVQSQQYQLALDELELIRAKSPELKLRFEPDRIKILQEYGRQLLREVRLRQDSGQSVLASNLLAAINKEQMSGELQIEFGQVQADITRVRDEAAKTRTMVVEFVQKFLTDQVLDDVQRGILRSFLNELETDISELNVDRLAAFVRVVGDTEQSVEQKISLALSGWLLGSNFAIDNLAVSMSLFPTRILVREYLTNASAARREEILLELAKLEGGDPQYLAKMIAQFLPLNPPDLQNYTGEKPIKLTVTIPSPKSQGEKPLEVDVYVQLPPQYDSYRQYPCIITLPGQNPPEEQLLYWTGDYNQKLGIRQGQAGRYGFIIAAVDWKVPFQNIYAFSAREHLTVLKAMREVLRRFSVDPDRMYLSGHFEGGKAAYDIAISHPEHFAGVIGISGGMEKYIDIYADNRHLRLPVYSVCGQRDQFRANCVRTWNIWLGSRAFNEATLVEYQGRLGEVFFEETPEILKWCLAHRRRLPKLGEAFELDCKSLRPWDNYFWFWESTGFPEKNITWPENYVGPFAPLKITASMKAAQPNMFRVAPSSSGEGGTLWLSPEIADFSQAIEIGDRGSFKGFVKPSRRTLLEDVRNRADRLHPYWAKVVCSGKKWSVVE